MTTEYSASINVTGDVLYDEATTLPSNYNGTTAPADLRNEDLAKVEIAVQALILYLALFGNTVVLVVLRQRRQKLTRMQSFIVHLSLVDIFVSFFNVLPQLIWEVTYRFYGNDFLCRFIRYFQVVAMYASSYVLVMTAIDRYMSICHPLTSQILTPKRVHLMVLLAWGLSLVFSSPNIFIFSYIEIKDKNVYDCWATFVPPWTEKLYTVWIFVSIFFVPTIILAFCYGKICHVVWMSVRSKEDIRGNRKKKSILLKISFRKRPNNHVAKEDDPRLLKTKTTNPRGHVKSLSKSKMKTVKLTLAVVLCYIICWCPFFVANLWVAFDPKAPFTGAAMVIILLLGSLNSCTNPWIYLAFSGRICGKQERRMSRSWTQSTQMTHTNDSESRTRSSMYDLANRNSREVSPWARESMTSSC